MYRIILIDDEVNAIEGLKILIDTERNHISEILTSNNAIDALKIIDEERPELIISDISMPQMTGLEMIAEIKKIENYNPMIIILSGYSTFTYAQTAMSHGVKAYLLKPVDEDELNDKIDELIGEIEANSQQTFERDTILESALAKIISGDNSKKTVSTFSSLLNGSKKDEVFLALSEIVYADNKDCYLSDEELDENFEKIKEIYENALKQYNFNAFKVLGNKIVSLVWDEDLDEKKLWEAYNEINSKISDSLSISIPVVAYNKVTGTSEIISVINKMIKDKVADDYSDTLEDVKNIDLKQVFEYIDNNYSKALTIKSIADEFKVDPVGLNRLFKKETHASINEFVTNTRIEKSKDLLLKTDKKVYEIASEIGFNDPNYYITKFLKLVGVTPSQYRKENA